VLLERAGLALDDPAWPGAGHSLADELLRPSVVYAPAVLRALGAGTDVHAAAHITGGGIPGNLGRALPADADAVVDRDSWEEPAIFGEIRRHGDVDDEEMARVFNLGVGMILVVAASDAGRAVAGLEAAGCEAAPVGTVVAGGGQVRMEGGR
jgi:phosphoribosylformylglycinamidine cyclo-ligase